MSSWGLNISRGDSTTPGQPVPVLCHPDTEEVLREHPHRKFKKYKTPTCGVMRSLAIKQTFYTEVLKHLLSAV